MKPSREVRNIVLGWYLDLGNGHASATELISLSDDAVAIGTDPQEFWVGGRNIRAIIKRQIEEVGRVKLEPGPLMAFEEGTVGWASDSATLVREGRDPFTVRCAFVLHREAGEWRIVLAHFSQARPNVEGVGRELTTSFEDVADLIERERPDLSVAASPDGTVTIIFTDIEASTALNEALGDDAFVPLHVKHAQIVEARTAEAGGTVVRAMGDGYMLVFPSARRGVECATAVQRDVAGLGVALKVRFAYRRANQTRRGLLRTRRRLRRADRCRRGRRRNPGVVAREVPGRARRFRTIRRAALSRPEGFRRTAASV